MPTIHRTLMILLLACLLASLPPASALAAELSQTGKAPAADQTGPAVTIATTLSKTVKLQNAAFGALVAALLVLVGLVAFYYLGRALVLLADLPGRVFTGRSRLSLIHISEPTRPY